VEDVAALVVDASRILPIGAQSSLTGGATPRGDLLVSTRALNGISRVDDDRVRVGAGVPLVELQRELASAGQYYPPIPTFDGAFVGGTIATNAAGAATFKYGSARRWVDAITVVLADGSIMDIHRGRITAAADGTFELPPAAGRPIRIPVPTYVMPDVAKLSAGYFARPGMDLIDLFIGSEGTLGLVTGATLRVIALPRRSVMLVPFASDGQAVAVTAALRNAAAAASRGEGPLDVSAVEFMDSRALSLVPDEAFVRARVTRPPAGTGLLLVQIELGDDEEAALETVNAILEDCDVRQDPHVALPGDDRGANRLFQLREAVPSSLNALIAAAKVREDQAIEKTAGDFIVPFDRLEQSIDVYRTTLTAYGLDHAIWGHVSDGNMHVNIVPRTLNDVKRGKEALLELGRRVIALGGAPLAEHGVGRSALKQQMLRDLYGEDGIAQMRAVKRAVDPTWKLADGVLFPR
jgi:D-lactate dehydrogenase (cytochrome)